MNNEIITILDDDHNETIKITKVPMLDCIPFLEFLFYRVQGLFSAFKNDIYTQTETVDVIDCQNMNIIKEIIENSNYFHTIEKLYEWFLLYQNYFSNSTSLSLLTVDQNMAMKIKNDLNHLISKNDVFYFSSDWLNGFYFMDDKKCKINNVSRNDCYFFNLCVNGYLFTAQWLMETFKLYRGWGDINLSLLFTEVCRYGHVHVLRWLLSLTGDQSISLKFYHKFTLFEVFKTGHINAIKYLLSLNGDRSVNLFDEVHIGIESIFDTLYDSNRVDIAHELSLLTDIRQVNNFDNIFWNACLKNKVDMVRFCLSLEGKRQVNVNYDKDMVFRNACASGYIEIVRLLLEVKPPRRVNVHVNNDQAFRWARENGHQNIMNLLLSLTDDRAIDLNKIERYLEKCRREEEIRMESLSYRYEGYLRKLYNDM